MVKLQGAIIAAGRGERLRDSVPGIPKPLVEIGGEPMLARQARALLDSGAESVIAVVNSETARLIEERRLAMPPALSLIVRDTANSMESLFAIGERLAPGLFILATVDAMIPQSEIARFKTAAIARIEPDRPGRADGALGVTKWRGDKRPLFAEVTGAGSIARLGADNSPLVTAGIYLLPSKIFELTAAARRLGLGAMREFLALLLERGLVLAGIEIADAIDVDEAADLAAARRAIKDHRSGEQ
ncbi:MAG: NTP transferase domain-containing protein [Candidatus Binataceae bacterium]